MHKAAKTIFKFGIVFPGFFALMFIGAIVVGFLKAKRYISRLKDKTP